jgi:hypothetical protein
VGEGDSGGARGREGARLVFCGLCTDFLFHLETHRGSSTSGRSPWTGMEHEKEAHVQTIG